MISFHNFYLGFYYDSGQKGYKKPDNEVRVSVKVLAINCLVNLVKISPDIFFLPLSHDASELDTDANEHQKIEDLCLYASHNDPLMRGSTFVLIGSVLESLVVRTGSDHRTTDISNWITILKNVIRLQILFHTSNYVLDLDE